MELSLSTGWILASMFVSLIGLGLFRFGKKEARFPQLITGLAFMVYPSFLASPTWILSIAGVAIVALWAATRAGI